MSTLGFELCEEDHLQNTQQWNTQQQRSSNRSRGRRFEHQHLSVVSISNAASGDISPPPPPPRRASAASRMRDYVGRSSILGRGGGRRSSSLGYDDLRNDEESTGAGTSVFSDDDDSSALTTYSEQRRRWRKCGMRLLGLYICLAGMVFLGVLLWRSGLIFQDTDDSVSAFRAGSNSDFDELGRMVCNGLTINCHRRANEIMYATVHNAMSSREDNFLAPNNQLRLEDALAAGFRGLTMDSCDCSRIGIQLCHGLCVAGFRRPVETFQAITNFMKQNPHEVVVVELEIADESLGPLFDQLSEVSGLFELMYRHPDSDEKWPKLKDMIEMDKRLIVFAHNDIGCEERNECPAGVHSTFKFAFETPFGQKSASALMDVDESCTVSRGWSNSDFVISNHFATNDKGLPDINVARVTNAAVNLQARLDACQEKFSTEFNQEVINLLVVDFWNIGDTVDVVYKYNSALPAKTDIPSEIPSTAPSLSPQPTSTASPTNVGGPSSSLTSLTPAPSVQPNTSMPTLTKETLATSQPPTPPPTNEVQSPSSSAPSVSLQSWFDSILYDPEADAPSASTNVSQTLSTSFPSPEPIQSWSGSIMYDPEANTSSTPRNVSQMLSTSAPPSESIPSWIDSLDPEANSSSPSTNGSQTPSTSTPSKETLQSLFDSTFGPETGILSPPSNGSHTPPTSAPSSESLQSWYDSIMNDPETDTTSPSIPELSPFLNTPSPDDEVSEQATTAPTMQSDEISTNTTAEALTPTPVTTVGSDSASTTPAPTFRNTENLPIQPEADKEELEVSPPQMEKEQPNDIPNVLLSSFGDDTSAPTPEDTTSPTEENDSHAIFAVEKNPYPYP